MKYLLSLILTLLVFLSGCSFQMESNQSLALFTSVGVGTPGDSISVPPPTSNSDYDKYLKIIAYRFTCLQVVGADGKFASPLRELQTMESPAGYSVRFNIPKLWVGRKYTLKVLGFKHLPNSETCPFDLPANDPDWAQLGLLENYVAPEKGGEVRIPVNFQANGDTSVNPTTPVIQIVFQPESTSISQGTPTSLDVVASVNPLGTLSFQWYTAPNGSGPCLGGTPVTGGTTARIYVPTSTAGTLFYCVGISAVGAQTVYSNWAQVTVLENSTSPTIAISQQPQSVANAVVGTSVPFWVVATVNPSTTLSTYEWYEYRGSTAPTVSCPGSGTSKVNSNSASFSVPANEVGTFFYCVKISAGTAIAYSDWARLDVINSISPNCHVDLYENAQDLSTGQICPGPDGRDVVLQYAASGFKIWMEKDGNRILNASGRKENGWQKVLNRAGTSFTDNLTDPAVVASIAGRVCPTNVFVNYDTMTAEGRCLYYDSGNQDPQALSRDSTMSGVVEAEDWLMQWDRIATGKQGASSYYEGNIKACADLGMRLPTAYETQMSKPPTIYLPSGDLIANGGSLSSDPFWAGSAGVPGIPSSNWTWTASATVASAGDYFVWNGSGALSENNYSTRSNGVRCVLPGSTSRLEVERMNVYDSPSDSNNLKIDWVITGGNSSTVPFTVKLIKSTSSSLLPPLPEGCPETAPGVSLLQETTYTAYSTNAYSFTDIKPLSGYVAYRACVKGPNDTVYSKGDGKVLSIP